jgi:hypothetical protein
MARASVEDYDRENKIRALEHLLVEACVNFYLENCIDTSKVESLTRQLIEERHEHAAV